MTLVLGLLVWLQCPFYENISTKLCNIFRISQLTSNLITGSLWMRKFRYWFFERFIATVTSVAHGATHGKWRARGCEFDSVFAHVNISLLLGIQPFISSSRDLGDNAFVMIGLLLIYLLFSTSFSDGLRLHLTSKNDFKFKRTCFSSKFKLDFSVIFALNGHCCHMATK